TRRVLCEPSTLRLSMRHRKTRTARFCRFCAAPTICARSVCATESASPLPLRRFASTACYALVAMSELLHLLREIATDSPSPGASASIGAWWKHHRGLCERWPLPIDRAVVGGLSADRLGYAFASGYREALVSLVPSLPDASVAVLSATEEQGVRPSNIRT